MYNNYEIMNYNLIYFNYFHQFYWWLLSDTSVSTPTGAHVTVLMPFDHVIQVAAMTARLTAGI